MPAPGDRRDRRRGEQATGLTVSSLVVADGETGRILFLCGLNTDLADLVATSGGFVVHVLSTGDEALSDRFAGIRPSPGGLFADLAWVAGVRGPVLTEIPSRVECAFTATYDVGWYLLIEGTVESVALGGLESPLLRLRGRYRRLMAAEVLATSYRGVPTRRNQPCESVRSGRTFSPSGYTI